MAIMQSESNKYQRKAFRVSQAMSDLIDKKCQERGQTFSEYVTKLIESDTLEHDQYLSISSARNSFMTVMMVGYLFDVLNIPKPQKAEYLKNIGQISNTMFGTLPPIPKELKATLTGNEPDLIAEIFEVYERHMQLQKDALKAK